MGVMAGAAGHKGRPSQRWVAMGTVNVHGREQSPPPRHGQVVSPAQWQPARVTGIVGDNSRAAGTTGWGSVVGIITTE